MQASTLLDRNQPFYQALLLGGACAVVGFALIAGYQATHQAIANAEEQDRLTSLNEVLPAASYDNNPLAGSQEFTHPDLMQPAKLMTATQNGHISGTAIQARVAGWGGPIDFIMATDPSGKILGVRVITHKETPGLADKIEIAKSHWITGFNGHSLSDSHWAVKKDGGDFDQFTGATITPRAMVKGIKAGLEVQQQWQQTQPTTGGKP